MDEWRRLVDDYGELVYTAAWRILRNWHDVEDVVQDVFLQAWQIREKQSVRHWGGLLRRLAICRAHDRLRQRRPSSELSTTHLPVTSSPDRVMDADELAERLCYAVAELPEQERVVFSLRYFEAVGNSEIAKLLNVSESAVSTALNKARKRLALQLQPIVQGDRK